MLRRAARRSRPMRFRLWPDGYLYDLHRSSADLAQCWPVDTSQAAAARSTPTAAPTVQPGSLPIRSAPFMGRHTHRHRRRLSSLAPDPQPRRRLLRRLELHGSHDSDQQHRLPELRRFVQRRLWPCGTGNAVADMLLGYYSGVGGFVPGPLARPTPPATRRITSSATSRRM